MAYEKRSDINAYVVLLIFFIKGNFDPQYVESVFITEGYFDIYNFPDETDDNKTQLVMHRRLSATLSEDYYTYDFIMQASDPFLNQNCPLPPGVELQLSFERLKANFSSINIKTSDALNGKILPIKNVFAEVEYISSPSLRAKMASIETGPMVYSYDDMDVIYKTIPVKLNFNF